MKSKQDRQKAAKLRKKKGPLTVEQKLFLASYDATKSKAAVRKPAAKPTTILKPVAPVIVRGPQLATAAAIQETVPPPGSIDPSAHTWTPTMPEAPEGSEPAPAGTPEQPAVGTPLVGDPASSQASSSGAPPLGDPHAAKQLAAIVMFITQVGMVNALELSAEMPIPVEIRAVVSNGENLTAYLKFVGESAERLAIKYNFKGIPLGDEAVVLGSVSLSVVAFLANTKRKRELAAKATAAPKQVEQKPPEAPPSTDNINALWESR